MEIGSGEIYGEFRKAFKESGPEFEGQFLDSALQKWNAFII